jgi:hypothetical protein
VRRETQEATLAKFSASMQARRTLGIDQGRAMIDQAGLDEP